MREKARHVALEHLASQSGMNRAIGAIIASRNLGCRAPPTSTPSLLLGKNDGHHHRHHNSLVAEEYENIGLVKSPFRKDIAYGTAEVCLPAALRYRSVMSKTSLNFETGLTANVRPNTWHVFGHRLSSGGDGGRSAVAEDEATTQVTLGDLNDGRVEEEDININNNEAVAAVSPPLTPPPQTKKVTSKRNNGEGRKQRTRAMMMEANTRQRSENALP
jgi:hypothetical protein